MLENNF